MSRDVKFSDDAQSDLLGAAVRLYEAEMYDLCTAILKVLIRLNNKEAHVLLGHCISEYKYEHSIELSRKHYEIACELGSSVGCYNLYLSHAETDSASAEGYLKKAVKLGWEE